MPGIHQIKTQLLEGLWLPYVTRGGNSFYPRLKKNKRMRLLTLASDRNFREVIDFEKNNLTSKDFVVVWTCSYIKKLRLETELSPAKVFGPTRYEDSISSVSFSLGGQFPFDVINLDFSSQDPDSESGRIEREIECFEKTIIFQEAQRHAGFVIIYTTVLNSNSLDYGSIVRTSNAVQVQGWPGIASGNFSPSITDPIEKIECVESVLREICSKYNYSGEYDLGHYPISGTRNHVCSIVALLSPR